MTEMFRSIIEPVLQILVLFILCKLDHSSNAHAQPSSGARCPIVGRILHLLPYVMFANSEGSGETARMRRLAWAFAGRLCDKYWKPIANKYFFNISFFLGALGRVLHDVY